MNHHQPLTSISSSTINPPAEATATGGQRCPCHRTVPGREAAHGFCSAGIGTSPGGTWWEPWEVRGGTLELPGIRWHIPRHSIWKMPEIWNDPHG